MSDQISGKKNKNRRRFPIFLLLAVLFIFLIRLSLYDGIVVRTYSVVSEKADRDYSFALITDLHSCMYGDDQSEILEIIEKHSPDAVFLVGDIADDRDGADGAAKLTGQIARLYDCYYATGNHERWVEYTDDIKEIFRTQGAVVLDDPASFVEIGSIRLFGIDDPLFYEDTMDYLSTLSGAPVSDVFFNLLLAHRPELFQHYAELGFDLTLSGHAHGGQIRLPFIMNGLYAPNQGWLPKYAGGLYEQGGSSLIVSRGLMRNELPRVFNPPEICIINIKRP